MLSTYLRLGADSVPSLPALNSTDKYGVSRRNNQYRIVSSAEFYLAPKPSPSQNYSTHPAHNTGGLVIIVQDFNPVGL